MLERVEWQSLDCSDVEDEPSCLLWCIWRERNYKSFEDCERTVVNLKSFFFNTLYHWAVAVDFPNLLGFPDFLECFSLSS